MRLRWLAAVLGVLIACPAGAQFDSSQCGDLDHDGTISVTDAVAVLRAAAGFATSCPLEACDTDRDGAIGLTDGVLVLRAAAALEPVYCRAPVNAYVRAVRHGTEEFPLRNRRPPASNGGASPIGEVAATTALVAGHIHTVVVPLANADGDLLVAVQREDGVFLDGYFEIALPADSEVVAYLGVEAAGAIGPEPFSLALAVSRDAAVSPWVTLPLTVAPSPELRFVETHLEGGGLDRTTIAVSPDGRHVYVATIDATASGSVLVFARRSDGTLTFVDELDTGPVSGVIVSPDGAHVYVSEIELAPRSHGAIVECTRDPETGVLHAFRKLRNGEDGTEGLVAFGNLAFSSDGRHLYATPGGRSDILGPAVVVFARDTANGELHFVEADGIEAGTLRTNARAIEVSPDGRSVYVAGTGPGSAGGFVSTLAHYRRDAASGALVLRAEDAIYGYDARADWIGDVADLAVSPDGANVYVATDEIADTPRSGPRLLQYDRNPTTGALTLARETTNYTAALDAFWAADALAMTPTGDRVFALTRLPFHSGGVVTFDRDATTGRLAYRDALVNGADGARGLLGGNDAAVSPDGRWLYVTGIAPTGINGALSAFAIP